MLRYATIVAPLLMRKGTPNPVRVLTGYVGALFLTLLAGIFLLAALFTWIATTYGLDVAFLTIAVILAVGAIGLTIMARVSQTIALKKTADRHARIKGMLAAKDDPLSEHIPDEVLTHPLSQKILAQVEDRPFMAGATAVGLGMMLSRQLLDAD
ncbi:MAG: phage holin family protein [Litorimonas sp.]